MFQFNHFNFNVLNLEKSLEFYKEALGLDVVREKDASDGSFKIVYLGDGSSDFLLELTWMRDQKEPYNLGDEEFHLALTADDFDKAHALHEKMGCICFENHDMGIYFINDRDSIWILICNTKDCTSGQYKVLDQSQQTGQCSNRIPVKEWNIQTDQSIPGILWRC